MNQTKNHKQFCHVGNHIEDCKLGLFQDALFAGDLLDSKSTSGGLLCVLGSHTFVPISWMCQRQTAVSHSSADYEIISLDAGLRRDGLPALQLGECVLGTFFPQNSPGETLSVINAIGSFRLISILRIVYVSPLTMFRPTFPTAS